MGRMENEKNTWDAFVLCSIVLCNIDNDNMDGICHLSSKTDEEAEVLNNYCYLKSDR
jgi:hypothetical protein